MKRVSPAFRSITVGHMVLLLRLGRIAKQSDKELAEVIVGAFWPSLEEARDEIEKLRAEVAE